MTATPTANDLLRHLVPASMADLEEYLNDLPFVAQQVKAYLEGDADSRRDMEAFHEGDGVGMLRDAVRRSGGDLRNLEIPEGLPPGVYSVDLDGDDESEADLPFTGDASV